jgi:hypothetical protein
MKTIIQTTTMLSTLALLFAANNGLEARDQRPDEVIAIQIERSDSKQKQNVAVEERSDYHVTVQEREDIQGTLPANFAQHVRVQERPDHVQVQERPGQHVQVQERDDTYCNHCHQRPYLNRIKPRYHGRVPVGHGFVHPNYGQGIVVYPYTRVPEPVIVHHYPPCHCHRDFSINWGFTFGR